MVKNSISVQILELNILQMQKNQTFNAFYFFIFLYVPNISVWVIFKLVQRCVILRFTELAGNWITFNMVQTYIWLSSIHIYIITFLLTEERECLLDKYHKDPEAIRAAVKACHDNNGGGTCIKAIPQLTPCFASWISYVCTRL